MNAKLKPAVLQYLSRMCRGRVNAGKAKVLAGVFQVDIREVNEAVRQLRREGMLIGSAKERPYGYYIPGTEQEVREYLGTFRNELFDMLETFNLQKRAARAYRENLATKDLFQADPSGQMAFA